MSATTILAHHLRTYGTIPTARVSSAKARGAAKYAYWGAVRYQVRLTADGAPTHTACERAGSDRRSRRLAEQDCENLCEREGRIEFHGIGRIDEFGARSILQAVGGYADALAKAEGRKSRQWIDPLVRAKVARAKKVEEVRKAKAAAYDRAIAVGAAKLGLDVRTAPMGRWMYIPGALQTMSVPADWLPFFAACATDAQAKLVFADWLEERGGGPICQRSVVTDADEADPRRVDLGNGLKGCIHETLSDHIRYLASK